MAKSVALIETRQKFIARNTSKNIKGIWNRYNNGFFYAHALIMAK